MHTSTSIYSPKLRNGGNEVSIIQDYPPNCAVFVLLNTSTVYKYYSTGIIVLVERG